MKKLHLPYVRMPKEFILLLKSNLSVVTTSTPVFDVLRPNRALYCVLEKSFAEFDDGRGIEKLLTALGWSNFRERLASLYVYKSIYGAFPTNTDMELVQDIKHIESVYLDHGVHGYSRLFLLGFYVRLANIETQTRLDGQQQEIKIPLELRPLLKLSQGRCEKIDWLILSLMHLSDGLGEKFLMESIVSGKKFNELFDLMAMDDRENMFNNFLAYGASINEPDFFLYEKV